MTSLADNNKEDRDKNNKLVKNIHFDRQQREIEADTQLGTLNETVNEIHNDIKELTKDIEEMKEGIKNLDGRIMKMENSWIIINKNNHNNQNKNKA